MAGDDSLDRSADLDSMLECEYMRVTKDIRRLAAPTRALWQAPDDSQMGSRRVHRAAELQSFGPPDVRVVHGQRWSVYGAVHALKHNQTGVLGYRKGIDLEEGNIYLASFTSSNDLQGLNPEPSLQGE
ncbi:hypothetical protein DFH06DRAFT_1131365 [Mycena polygramma]|nr:hypothetical protein DFH06DRAFT_1131365 [Mycena polygramma]